jgi:hypothetical protein
MAVCVDDLTAHVAAGRMTAPGVERPDGCGRVASVG